MYKFIFSAFGDEIASSLDEQIEVLKKHGIEYLEFRSANGKNIADYTEDEAKEVLRKLKDSGIKVSAIGSPIGKVDVNCDFEKYLELFRHIVELAHVLETKYIRIFSFYVPEGEEEKYTDVVVERLSKFTEIAKKEDIILLHENEKEIYGSNAERCYKILSTINSPNLRATFDPANFVQCKVEVYPHAFELLKNYIEYVHIKDAKFSDGSVTVAGEGNGRLKDVIAALKRIGFCGFLSIEPHLNNNLPGGGPENFAKAYRAIKRIIDEEGEI
ncbi:Xylose isomerase domain-containing protein TIM barrel [Caldicellulosiruptor owensensis OL]|uniref:Xylose isomerase domain-containing protein TIM barrel n=1 Tax=Caldicellulosiruptor owensensis (strain ATCC 700167 / DSM 13100 / OL) TaxID=632518 RepID=E4Q690_CALOW|nr:sugar phosphate isomerase/epimerase family protein [Caldicellulosiruptor owensensis]ADQ05575.1 Xylose isomerase domain-containing protein TIM barrel [Caldicellulosiruptor owensensis OL]